MQRKPEYINYLQAMTILRERFDGVTSEELAAWLYMTEPKQVCAKLNEKRERCSNEVLRRGDMCEEHGGKQILEDEIKAVRQHSLYAYLSARELDPPPPFLFGNHDYEPLRDYQKLLYRLYFKADDVAQFEPRERFITGRELLVLLANQTEIPPNTTLDKWHEMQSECIRNATKECRLNPFHPTLGLTQETNTDAPFYAPLEEGLFSMAEVKAYEREEFGRELDASAAKVEAQVDTTPSDNIPGTLPQTNIGRLAIRVAWQIECATGKRATASQVIKRLQELEPEEPIITKIIPHGVMWVTTKGTEKSFDVATCAKALSTWNATRA